MILYKITLENIGKGEGKSSWGSDVFFFFFGLKGSGIFNVLRNDVF